MKLRVLGCSGAIAQGCRTTAFLLGPQLLVDAGTGVGELRMDELLAIDHVLLSHSHLDHIAALPLMLDAVGAHRQRPLQVWALPETLAALRAHVFNDIIWPDFTRIPTPAQPFVQLHSLAVGQRLQLAGLEVQVLPARHSVPAVGYAVRGAKGWWVYSGDTGGEEPAFWQRVQALRQDGGVAALFIETAFSNQEQALARKSGHLAPASLARELQQLGSGADFPVYITHAKPRESQRIMREVQALEQDAFTLIDLQTVDALEL